MARIEPRLLTLHDGRAVRVRSAELADAPGLVALERDQIATDPHRVREPDEDVRDEGRFAQLIAEGLAGPTGLMLVATPTDGGPVAGGPAGGEVVGRLNFRPERWRKTVHRGELGIVVHSAWRGLGVGTALIAALLDWAAAHPTLEKIELSVFAINTGARRLYRRLGFRAEGRSRRHFKMADGRVVDDVRMAIFVKPGVAPEGSGTWRSAGA